MACSNPSYVLSDYDNPLDIEDADLIPPNMESTFWSNENNAQQNLKLDFFLSDDLGYGFGQGTSILTSTLDTDWNLGHGDYAGVHGMHGSTLSEMCGLAEHVSTVPPMARMESYSMPGTSYQAQNSSTFAAGVASSLSTATSVYIKGPGPPSFSVKEESEHALIVDPQSLASPNTSNANTEGANDNSDGDSETEEEETDDDEDYNPNTVKKSAKLGNNMLKRQLMQKPRVTRSGAAGSQSTSPSESSKEKPAAIRKRRSDDVRSQPRNSLGGKKMCTELKKQLETATVKVPGKLNDKTAGTSSNRPQPKKIGPKLTKKLVKLSALPNALQGIGADAKKPLDNFRRAFTRAGKKEPRRAAQMIDALPRPPPPPPAKVAKTAAAKTHKLPPASNEPKKSVEFSSPNPELPVVIGDDKLLDHDYCSPLANKSGSLRETAIKRSKRSRLTTGEYLQQQKSKVSRSAPVTPLASPKPTRGSKRSNNYMIETKTVNDEISKIKLNQVVNAVSSKVNIMANPPVVALPEPLIVKNNLKPNPNMDSLHKYIQQVVEIKSGSPVMQMLPDFCTIKEEPNGKVHTVSIKQVATIQSFNTQPQHPFSNCDPRLTKPQKINSTVSLPSSPRISKSNSPSLFEDDKTKSGNLDHMHRQFKKIIRTPDAFKVKPSAPGGKDCSFIKVMPSKGGVTDRSRALTFGMNDNRQIYSMKNVASGTRIVSVKEMVKMNTTTTNPSIMTNRPNQRPSLLHNRTISTSQVRKWPPSQLTLLSEIQKHQLQAGATASAAAPSLTLAPGKKPCRVVNVMPPNFRKIHGSSYSVVRPGTTNQTLQIMFPTTTGAQGNVKGAPTIHPTLPARRMLKVLTSKNNTATRSSISSPQVNGSSLKLLTNVSCASPVNTTTTVPPGVRVMTLPVASCQQISPSSTSSMQPMVIRPHLSQTAGQIRGPIITSLSNSPAGNRVLLTNTSAVGGALQHALTSSSHLSSSSSPVSHHNLNHLPNSIHLSSLIEPKTENQSDQDTDQYFSHGRTPTSTSASRQLSPHLTNEDVFITQEPIRKPRPMKFNIKQQQVGKEEPLGTSPVMRNNEPPDATGAGAGYLKERLEQVMERGRTTVKKSPAASNIASASSSTRSSRQVSRSSSRDTSSGASTSSVPTSRDSSSESNRSPIRFQRASPTYSAYDGQSPRSPPRSPRARHRASFRNYRAGRQSNNFSGENEFGGAPQRRAFKRGYGGDDREREAIKRRRRDDEAAVKEMERGAVAERRVVFVGGLLPETTEDYLQERFQKFGKIKHIKMKRRNQRDGHLSDYAFVYFETKEHANSAIEEGNNGEEVEFQLSFGGRRQFCKSEYADLDNVRDDEQPALRANDAGQDLQELIRQHQKEQERNL